MDARSAAIEAVRAMLGVLRHPLDPPGPFALAVLREDLDRVARGCTGRALTEEEFEQVRHHGEAGFDALLDRWQAPSPRTGAPPAVPAHLVRVGGASFAEVRCTYQQVTARRDAPRPQDPFVRNAPAKEARD